MKIRTKNVIEVSDWDKVVTATYGRPYNFQQQDGCQDRGRFNIVIPAEAEDFEKDIVPENVNDEEMENLIKALQILLKYGNPTNVLTWQIDIARVNGVRPSLVANEDVLALKQLGVWANYREDYFYIELGRA